MKLTENSYFKFSGGEVHCKMEHVPQIIIMKDYTMNGFMALAEYVEVIHRKYPSYNIEVTYPYLPYARQDRVMNDNEPFSLHVFARLLNCLRLSKVIVVDPHSDVTPALVHRCVSVHQWEIAKGFLPQNLFDDPEVMFVSPDAGAYKKVAKLVLNDYRIVLGTKIRGTDGNIIKTDIYSPVELTGKTCVVIDDICDGGRTFTELGKVLKHKGAKKLILYITHGIFSKGLAELLLYYDEIYTTNSFNMEAYADYRKSGNLVVKELF